MDFKVKYFDKMHCPFLRKKTPKTRQYLAKDSIQEGFEWLFDDGVIAVDKIDGTNACYVLDERGEFHALDNRTRRVLSGSSTKLDRLTKQQWVFLEAIHHSRFKGFFKDLTPGYHYGEIIGPKVNGNRHKLSHHLFVPFPLLSERCQWQSWANNEFQKDFEHISDWFKDLPSLFSERFFHKRVTAEGLVFYHPSGKVCKIRRDMFEWYY